jgi:alkylhydroperoxidase family enzyme
LQGEQYSQVADALRDGDLDRAEVTDAERLLLRYVETLTRHAYRITDSQVQGLRDAGWSDAQIAEATYVGALFNLFVRLADAFDIHPPP